MREGDFLTCKKNYYNDSRSGQTYKFNFFKTPIFKKGKRYKIMRVDKIYYGPSGSTSISTISSNNYYEAYTIYGDNNLSIGLTIWVLGEFFYSTKELRKLKIKKIEYGV